VSTGREEAVGDVAPLEPDTFVLAKAKDTGGLVGLFGLARLRDGTGFVEARLVVIVIDVLGFRGTGVVTGLSFPVIIHDKTVITANVEGHLDVGLVGFVNSLMGFNHRSFESSGKPSLLVEDCDEELERVGHVHAVEAPLLWGARNGCVALVPDEPREAGREGAVHPRGRTLGGR
jgi:hypothetical protein